MAAEKRVDRKIKLRSSSFIQVIIYADISLLVLFFSLTWRLFLCVRQIIGTRAHFRNSISNAQSIACIVERKGKDERRKEGRKEEGLEGDGREGGRRRVAKWERERGCAPLLDRIMISKTLKSSISSSLHLLYPRILWECVS
jgi:hypothetical protein